ncbi:hypothetical protein P775_19480 [Puniceibacterium antarcticum]|uniref:Glycosyl transferase family 1 domain-containing protein n=1 Tax=Puniceibacterium antarcticum TaxID=1206336 RepID=A0A2G8RB44_9RHOB|nr:glycosyltransferase [Puniceibacterium antarcticum]PIL18752.1 hypothetical protein P775_19480 [Puniceibacterium antarcticum]
MKPCIAVESYYSPGQTFVNRHIDHLFGGAACVLADKDSGLRPLDGRFFIRSAHEHEGTDRIIAPFARAANHVTHGTQSVPFGSERRAMLAFLQTHRPDFILSEFGPQGVTTAPIAAAAGIPMFCYFRGSDASSRIRHKHVQRAYQKMMPRLAGVFAVSQFLLDNLASVGVTHPNAHVIPSGVNIARFRAVQKVPGSCMALGRFVEKKAPLLTIRAFSAAHQVAPQARLTMIGDGELLEPARALVQELGLQDAVSLPGALPHDQVRDAMVRTEMFLQHSVTARNRNTEGLPTAIQEAMAAGCVIVTTRHAGIPEAITAGETGFMVDEYDAEAYNAQTLRAMLLTPEDKQRIGARAAEVAAERFDNGTLLSVLEEQITQTLARLRR